MVRIATSGQWFRCYGNELWEFADNGLMARREASINDVEIAETSGHLTDHYDPRKRGVFLSETVFSGRSVAAT